MCYDFSRRRRPADPFVDQNPSFSYGFIRFSCFCVPSDPFVDQNPSFLQGFIRFSFFGVPFWAGPAARGRVMIFFSRGRRPAIVL